MSARFRSSKTSVTIRNIRLASLFKPEDVLHRSGTATGDEIVHEMLSHLALHYGIGNIKDAEREVKATMAKDPPLVKPGLAVPYGRPEKITEPLVAIATSEQGFQFEDGLAYLVMLVLTPVDLPGAYTQILRGIEKACDRDNAAREVAGLKSPLAVWQYFDAGGHRLPDHLQARHVMDNLRTFLYVNDTLRTAIDRFIEFNTAELPVLTADHEIVGVVTIKRLVKLCLPDYLTWVDDMTPYLNFEPLAEIIRNESSTWLREFMTQDFAHVEEDSPAVLALKEIGQKETLNAYVLRGRQLVGIIRMLEFTKSILR